MVTESDARREARLRERLGEVQSQLRDVSVPGGAVNDAIYTMREEFEAEATEIRNELGIADPHQSHQSGNRVWGWSILAAAAVAVVVALAISSSLI